MTGAKLPRVALSLAPATHRVIAKLAMQQKRPKSAICADLLEEMTPALEQIAKLTEAAMRNRARLPADTAAKLGALEDLLGHTAAFGLERMEAAVSLPERTPEGPRSGPRRPRRGH